MLRILVLNHEFPPVGGGASPVAFELCKELVKTGNEVDVVTMRYKNLPRYEIVDGINIYRTWAIRKKADICYMHELATYFPGAVFKALSLAKQKKYDVIHCHFIVPGAPLAWFVSKRRKVPFLITCHGTDVPGHNPERFKLVHKIIRPVWRKLAKSAQLIAPSNFLKKRIIESCAAARVKIIPNGINLENFKPVSKTKSILMCSRMLKFKGFQYAIEALRDIEPDWQVNIIGEGPYLQELKQMAQGLKAKINFLGWIDKSDERFYKFFNESSIFIFPSEAENFPTVLLEAMAAGTAIITSNAGGCPEVVGDAALLVEPRNPGQIREKLQELIDSEDLRKELSESAHRRASEFSWPNIAEKYIECYQQLISKKDSTGNNNS